jgi:GT2 family glycosyltransferase
VLNFRTPELTLACVRSLCEQAGPFDLHISVVDNASGDGSEAVMRAGIDALDTAVPVHLVVSDQNGGFSAGHNLGIGLCRAPYHLVINSDTVLREGAIAALLAVAETEPSVGLVAPRLEGDDGRVQTSCFRLPGVASEMIRGARTGFVTQVLAEYDMPLPAPRTDAMIGWVSFACVLIRERAFNEIGPMDDGYFLYFEDADYCARLRAADWGIRYVTDARVIHFRGGSAPVKSLSAQKRRLPRYWYASRTRLFYKLHGFHGLLLANLAWTAGRAIAWLRLLAGREVPAAHAQEWRDIWTNFLQPLGGIRAPERN